MFHSLYLAHEKELRMFTLPLFSLMLAAAQPTWHTDYDRAGQLAIKEKKDLLIHFYEDDRLDGVFQDTAVKQRLANFVCLQVHSSYKVGDQRLLDYPALREMMG